MVEHEEDTLTGLDLWEKDDSVATVGANQKLNIFSPSLALVHTFLPAHARFISSVACNDDPVPSLGNLQQGGCGQVVGHLRG